MFKMRILNALFTVLLLASSSWGANIEHYYQISPKAPKVEKGKSGGGKPANLYWRTSTLGNQTEIFDLCADDENKPIGTATGTDSKWTMGDQELEIDEDHFVKVKIKGQLYAEGFDIKPIACDKEKNKPMVQPEIIENQSDIVAIGTGAKHIEASRGKTLMVNRAVIPTKGKPTTSEAIPAGTLMCKTAPLTEEAVRDLVDSPALGRNDQFYPGNLIRGKDLANGQFVPITIGRGPGRLVIKGVTFKEPDAKTFIDVEEMSESQVTQGIKELLDQETVSTEANISFITKTVYSMDQLAFALGSDGRYANAQFSASFNMDKSGKKNNVLARFTQIYYTISVEDPESSYSPFCAPSDPKKKKECTDDDDDKPRYLKDPEYQIAADNPPLYFKQVGYGRTIYFLASSTESSTAVKAALEGAYGNKDAGNYLGVNSESTYKSVMANTSVSYFVLGGDAVVATKPITASDPQKMFDAVKKVMADEGSSQVGPRNRGLPISYTVNYLTNRKPASLGYATSYDQTDCTIIPTGYYSFALEQTCVDDSVTVSVTNQVMKEEIVTEMSGGFSGNEYYALDDFIPKKDENVTVRIKQYNIAGPWCSDFKFTRTAPTPDPKTGEFEVLYLQGDNRWDKKPYEIKLGNGGDWLVGTRSDFKIRLNRATGNALVQSK